MNIKLLAILTIASIAITYSLFFFGIIAIDLPSRGMAMIIACLAAILVNKLIGYIIKKYKPASHTTGNTPQSLDALPVDDKITYTNLHDATNNGSLVEVERLINTEGTDVNANNQEGNTTLLCAIFNNDNEVIDSLITAGADINASNSLGFTLLYYAIDNGKIEIVRKLIEAGLNISLSVNNYRMPYQIHLAIKKGYMSDIEASSDSNETPMSIAIKENQPSIVDLLIEKGAILHGRYLHDALFMAKNSDIAMKLIQNGVDNIDARDLDDNTPLMMAAMQGYIEIVKLLIRDGANVNHASNSHHFTALHLAALNGHAEIVKLLIESKADVNATIPQETVLYWNMLEDYPQMNLNNISFTPLLHAIIEDKQTTALTIIHYGKVPYADIPVIENNPTSEYIQRQYQLATTQDKTLNYASGFFTALKPSPKDTIMARIKLFVKGTGDKGTYPLTTKLLYNGKGIPADLIKIIMEYAGLLPNNMNMDLNALIIDPYPSRKILPAESTTCAAAHASDTSVNAPKP